MRKFLILAMLSCSSLFAMDTPIIMHSNDSPSASAVNYQFPWCGNSQLTTTWNATEANRSNVVAVAGRIKGLYARISVAAGAAKSRTFTVRKNGADTSITCIISGAADTSCTDTANSFSVVPGDYISLSATPVGTPAAATVQAYMVFSSGIKLSIISGSGSAATTNSAVRYAGISGDIDWNATEINRSQVFPTGGTLSNLYVLLSTAPTAGKSYAFLLQKNGADSTITCTVSDTGTACSDLSNSVAFVAGDTVSMKSTPSGTPTASRASFSMKFAPTTDGEAVLLFGVNQTLTSGGNFYYSITGNGVSDANDAQAGSYVPDMTLKKMYVTLGAYTSAAGNYTIRAMNNAAASSHVVILTSGTTSGQDTTHELRIRGNPAINTYITSGSITSASTNTKVGYVAVIDPPHTYYNVKTYNSTDY